MIRRLILRLDPSAIEPAQLSGYAALARALDAELMAELEEDEQLNTLASLPFITEVCRDSASARTLNAELLQRRAERLMAQLNRELQQIAQGHPIRWQLVRVSANTPLQPTKDAAILHTARAERYRGSRQQEPGKRYLAIVDAGDQASARALNYARTIAEQLERPLLLLALPNSPWHQSSDRPEQVDATTSLATINSDSLRPLLRAWHTDLLILPSSLLSGRNTSLQLPGVQVLITP